jgi:hypothetical protein
MKLIISGFILFSVLLVSNIHCAGDQSSVIWKSASNGAIPAGAIVAGHESDGPILYAARAYYQGGLHPGKIETGFGGAHIAWGGKEISVPNYEVLCWISPREGATYGSKSGKGETSGSSQSSSNNDGSESDQSDELVE